MGDMQVRLLRAVDAMPGFPRSVQRILELTADVNCSQKQLVEVIRTDPVFTLKILRMANSAYFSMAQEVTSVNQASVYLGLNTLKNLALSLAVVGSLPRSNGAGFDMQAFWLHSLAVAAAARLLDERIESGGSAGGDAFAAGLLHDTGKIIFALHVPDAYRTVLRRSAGCDIALHDLELDAFGLTHAELGARLAGTWNLPAELVECISGHHAPSVDSRLAACVGLANQVVKYRGYGYAGNNVFGPLPELARRLFPGNLPELAVGLDGLEAEVQKARMLVQLGGGA